MTKFHYLILSSLLLILAGQLAAQNTNLNADVMKQLQTAYDGSDAETIALSKAIANNPITDLALNRIEASQIDHHFKYRVEVKGITDQKSSGRCWMFTSYNVLRPKVMQKYNLNEFEFSTNYLYFYDLLEKSNLFLESIIESRDKAYDSQEVIWLFRSPVGDGGVWNSFTNLAEKYGVVPKSIMPETHQSESTRRLRSILNEKLREGAYNLREMKGTVEELQKAKIEILQDAYRILALGLGEPPTEFEYRFVDKDGNIGETKTYTPQSFYDEAVGVDLSEYVLFMDDPTRPYNQLYEIEKDRNVLEGKNWLYINLPADKIKEMAKNSIMANEAMYFSCDVGVQLNSDAGLLSLNNYDYASLFGVDFSMNKKARILSRESASSHGMALVGVDVDSDGNITKWLLENSWGDDSGHKGYLTMTDEWFDEYMFRVVIHKKFVPADVLKILDKEPTLLPPWDPMFLFDN